MAGTFRVGPATVQSMYAPEFAAYSAGAVLEGRFGRVARHELSSKAHELSFSAAEQAPSELSPRQRGQS